MDQDQHEEFLNLKSRISEFENKLNSVDSNIDLPDLINHTRYVKRTYIRVRQMCDEAIPELEKIEKKFEEMYVERE